MFFFWLCTTSMWITFNFFFKLVSIRLFLLLTKCFKQYYTLINENLKYSFECL